MVVHIESVVDLVTTKANPSYQWRNDTHTPCCSYHWVTHVAPPYNHVGVVSLALVVVFVVLHVADVLLLLHLCPSKWNPQGHLIAMLLLKKL